MQICANIYLFDWLIDWLSNWLIAEYNQAKLTIFSFVLSKPDI